MPLTPWPVGAAASGLQVGKQVGRRAPAPSNADVLIDCVQGVGTLPCSGTWNAFQREEPALPRDRVAGTRRPESQVPRETMRMCARSGGKGASGSLSTRLWPPEAPPPGERPGCVPAARTVTARPLRPALPALPPLWPPTPAPSPARSTALPAPAWDPAVGAGVPCASLPAISQQRPRTAERGLSPGVAPARSAGPRASS